MDVEIIDKRLVVTPTTHDDVRLIYAIAAAWTAFGSSPVSENHFVTEGRYR